MRFARSPLPRPILPAAWLVLALSLPGGARAQLSSEDILKLNEAATDSTSAVEAVTRARQLLVSGDENYAPFFRRMLLQGLLTSRAPVAQVLGAADTLDQIVGDNTRARIALFLDTAEHLLKRGESDAARAAVLLGRRAMALAPEDEMPRERNLSAALLGRAYLDGGQPDSAARYLERVLPFSADSVRVLYHLGRAHQVAGRTQQAIGAYLRSVSVYPGRDTMAAAPLRELVARSGGDLAAIEARIAEGRKSSRRQIAKRGLFTARPSPEWKLPDLEGRERTLADYPGKAVVLDFWGSWCGPCRAELPIVQRVYETYKDRGVAFVGVNWERNLSPDLQRETAKKFVEQFRLTFPNVLDGKYTASTAYGVQSFPSLLVLDAEGKIRYWNIGFDPQIEHVLTAQIEEVLGE